MKESSKKTRKKQLNGQIIVDKGVKNVWPFEMHSALALKELGYIVRFVPPHNSVRSADAYLNNTLFEFKSPTGSTIKCVENNLDKALKNQSKNIVIDSCRIKDVRDKSILNYLTKRLKRKKGIKHLIFVTREGKAIDINEIIR
ncbi:hypothetical protein IJG20_01080 [Candidatus Saccharibacteria bacterium]|nr:hypothetical protein [Candidatus Saccharibacteria bacterium]